VPTSKSEGRVAATSVLSMLLAAHVLAYTDRQLLGLLTEPIKHELHFSDVQIGLLQGFGLSLVLALAGLPIGRMVDMSRRITILAGGVVLWSVMTMACGLAVGFGSFLACRVGLGIGEAAVTPCAYSLIGDVLPREKQGRGISLYALGPYVGIGLAFVLGALVIGHLPAQKVFGWLAPWRLVFLVVGAIGAPMALWAASLREPSRHAVAPVDGASVGQVLRYFRGNAGALIGAHATFAFTAMALTALSAWVPAWFARTYRWPVARSGAELGVEILVCGVGGAAIAGFLGDALKRRGWPRLATSALSGLAATPLCFMATQAAMPELALLWLAPTIFLLALSMANGPAVLQEITPNRMRGVQHSLAALTVSTIGMGAGPLAVALVTDEVLRDEGRISQALHIVLPVMTLGCALSALASIRAYVSAELRTKPPTVDASNPVERSAPA
jgi:MFS family permease